MYYILISVIIILLFIIFYNQYKFNNNLSKYKQDEINKIKRSLSDYQKEIEEKKQECLKNYKEFLEQTKEKESLINKTVNDKEQYLEQYYNQQLKSKEELLQQQLNIKKERLEGQFKQEEERINNTFNIFCNSIENEKSKIQQELSNLYELRESTIKTWKAEEEKREKQQYYKISLSQQDKEDIEILRSIECKLSNKEALNRLIYEVFIKKPLGELLNRVIGNTTYSGIYKITHIESQKSYIGQSVDVKKRLTEHVKGSFKISNIADQQIHHAMSKYGVDQFTFEILEQVPKDKLNEREKYWIKFYQSQSWGWNNTSGGAK